MKRSKVFKFTWDDKEGDMTLDRVEMAGEEFTTHEIEELISYNDLLPQPGDMLPEISSPIHQHGRISIDNIPGRRGFLGDVGIQTARDGRIWICIDGKAFLRFSPSLGIGTQVSAQEAAAALRELGKLATIDNVLGDQENKTGEQFLIEWIFVQAKGIDPGITPQTSLGECISVLTNRIEKGRAYTEGCPHDGNGRHHFEPRYTEIEEPILHGPAPFQVKKTKQYICDVCVDCGAMVKNPREETNE